MTLVPTAANVGAVVDGVATGAVVDGVATAIDSGIIMLLIMRELDRQAIVLNKRNAICNRHES